jgi:hypothetical protein
MPVTAARQHAKCRPATKYLVPQLLSDPLHRPMLGVQLRAQRSHYPHRGGLRLRSIRARGRLPRRLLFRHDSILVFKFRSLHTNPGDSPPPTDGVHRRGPRCADKRVGLPLPAWHPRPPKVGPSTTGHPRCGRSSASGGNSRRVP